jgi:signal peptidase II
MMPKITDFEIKIRFYKFLTLALIVMILDQLSKLLVLNLNPKIDLGILQLHLVKNTGAGFGILQGHSLILGVLSLIVAGTVIIFYRKIPAERKMQILGALFLGGVLGNMIDRLFRGFVVDFIDLNFWPAFNLADSFLTVSVIWLIIELWRDE